MMAYCVIEYDVLRHQYSLYFPLDPSKRENVRIKGYARGDCTVRRPYK